MSNNGTNTTKVTCANCGQVFSVAMPQTQVINTPKSSLLLTPHMKAIICPNAKCAQAYAFYIEDWQIKWGAFQIDEEQRRNLEGSNIISLTSNLH